MKSKDTRAKLERLYSRSPGPASPAPPAGAAGEGDGVDDGNRIALKARLEKLIQAASERERLRPRQRERELEREREREVPARRVTPLEEALDGREVETARGPFYCVDRYLPLNHHHGTMNLGRIADVPSETFEVLARGSLDPEIALDRALFIDTETTGLAGGSGTYAFLVGLGFVEDGAFVVRQLFMRDYREERAMLTFLAQELARFDVLVTYNGKSFDVPLLETRLVLARERFDFAELAHFDLLHPARSLWKARFESCRLAELEYLLLGLEREEDIPGHLIPDVYFRYVRTGDAEKLRYVFQHNHDDILSLAALTVAASDMLDENAVPDNPIDDVSLGRLFERTGDAERTERHYSRAVESGVSGMARQRSLRALAELKKRQGEHEEARRLWQELSSESGSFGLPALKELAMDAEHRSRELDRALSYVEEALTRLSGGGGLELPPGTRARWREELQHRRRRLERRARADAKDNERGREARLLFEPQ